MLSRKKELSSGGVAFLCLVSMTDRSCMCTSTSNVHVIGTCVWWIFTPARLMNYPVYQERDAFALASTLKIRPAKLSCLSGSVSRASAQYAACRGFKSHLRQLIFFSEKKNCFECNGFASPCSLTDVYVHAHM